MNDYQKYLSYCQQFQTTPLKDVLQFFSENSDYVSRIHLGKENNENDLLAISKTLLQTDRQVYLSLEQFDISEISLQLLGELLQKTFNLVSLKLKDNRISSLGNILNGQLNVEEFDITNNKIKEYELEQLLKILSKNNKVKKLILNNIGIQDTQLKLFEYFIENNSTIHFLSLANNKITGNGVRNLEIYLRKNYRIIELVLAGNVIGDEGFIAITKKNMDRMKLLDLDNCKVTTRGLEVLKQNIVNFRLQTEYLNLSNCNLGSNGAKSLFQCLGTILTQIKILEISNNKIGSSAIPYFISYSKIPQYMLEMVNLSHNLLDDEGVIMLSEIFVYNRVLIQIDCRKNCVSQFQVPEIEKFIQQYNASGKLILGDQLPKTQDFLEKEDIQEQINAEKINISETVSVRVQELWEYYEMMCRNKLFQNPLVKLEQIYRKIIGNGIDDSESITQIQLQSVTLNAYALDFIAQLCVNLQSLMILEIDGCNIEIKDLQQFFAVLKKCPHLFFFCLRDNQLNAQGIQYLIQFIEDRRDDNQVDLDIENNCIETQGFLIILNYMKSPRCKLNSLKVGYNMIDSEGGDQLALFFEENSDKNIIELSFDGNMLSEQSASSLINSLSNNHHLRRLSLAYCGLTPKIGKTLQRLLKQSRSIEFMCIDGNMIDDKAAQDILDGLQQTKTLISIVMRKTNISQQMISKFHSSLKFHPSIQEILFSGNELSKFNFQTHIYHEKYNNSLSLVKPEDLRKSHRSHRHSPQQNFIVKEEFNISSNGFQTSQNFMTSQKSIKLSENNQEQNNSFHQDFTTPNPRFSSRIDPNDKPLFKENYNQEEQMFYFNAKNFDQVSSQYYENVFNQQEQNKSSSKKNEDDYQNSNPLQKYNSYQQHNPYQQINNLQNQQTLQNSKQQEISVQNSQLENFNSRNKDFQFKQSETIVEKRFKIMELDSNYNEQQNFHDKKNKYRNIQQNNDEQMLATPPKQISFLEMNQGIHLHNEKPFQQSNVKIYDTKDQTQSIYENLPQKKEELIEHIYSEEIPQNKRIDIIKSKYEFYDQN